MSRADELKPKADRLERANELLRRAAELARQNAALTKAAQARARRQREGVMPSAGKLYAKHNRKA